MSNKITLVFGIIGLIVVVVVGKVKKVTICDVTGRVDDCRTTTACFELRERTNVK